MTAPLPTDANKLVLNATMKATLPGIVPTPRSSVTNAARWVTWPETVPKNLTTEYHLKPSMKIDASSEFQDVQNEKEIISVMGGIEKKNLVDIKNKTLRGERTK